MSEERARVITAIRRFRFHSVYIRDFLVAMVLVLLPLLGLNVFIFQASERMVTDEASVLSDQALRNTRGVVDSVFRQVDYLAASISLDNETELYALSPDLTGVLARDPVRWIAAQLRNQVYSNPFIHSMYVYSEARDRIITHLAENDRASFRDQSWLPVYESINSDEIVRRFLRVADRFPNAISTIKPLYLVNQEIKLGAVVINVDIDELKRVLIEPGPNSPEFLYVFDEDGTILFSTNSDELGRNRDEIDLASIAENTNAVVSTENSTYYPWEYLSIHALDTYVLRSAQLRGIVAIVFALSIVATIVAAVLIAGNAYRPIRRILEFVENPDARPTLDDSIPANETRYIAGAIARFTQSNGELRDELHRQLDLIDETRVSALQIQINPHFLNNTLEVISMTARRLTSGANDVTRMVTLLSRLLRTALDTSEQVVPFSEEIEHANLFLAIIAFRYGDRIRVEWDIPESLTGVGMLKLSLQPLIENAFYHGIKPTRGTGTIWIAAREQNGELVTTVTNTGRRMSASELARIRRSLSAGYDFSAEHIGLRNVYQRIRLVFGTRYGLDISSGGKDFGAVVTIRTPVIQDAAAQPG